MQGGLQGSLGWGGEGCLQQARVSSPAFTLPGFLATLHCTAKYFAQVATDTGGFTITKYKTRRPLWRRATDKETSMWSPQVTLHSFEKQKKTFGAFEVCKQKQIWNNTELHRILWDSLDSLRFFGILWNSVGFIKGFLKILKHSERFSNQILCRDSQRSQKQIWGEIIIFEMKSQQIYPPKVIIKWYFQSFTHI